MGGRGGVCRPSAWRSPSPQSPNLSGNHTAKVLLSELPLQLAFRCDISPSPRDRPEEARCWGCLISQGAKAEEVETLLVASPCLSVRRMKPGCKHRLTSLTKGP